MYPKTPIKVYSSTRTQRNTTFELFAPIQNYWSEHPSKFISVPEREEIMYSNSLCQFTTTDLKYYKTNRYVQYQNAKKQYIQILYANVKNHFWNARILKYLDAMLSSTKAFLDILLNSMFNSVGVPKFWSQNIRHRCNDHLNLSSSRQCCQMRSSFSSLPKLDLWLSILLEDKCIQINQIMHMTNLQNRTNNKSSRLDLR